MGTDVKRAVPRYEDEDVKTSASKQEPDVENNFLGLMLGDLAEQELKEAVQYFQDF